MYRSIVFQRQIIHFQTTYFTSKQLYSLLNKCVLYYIDIPPYPRKSYTSDPVAQHVSNDGRIRVSSWKKCMKLRWVPVCNARHDYFLKISNHCLPMFTFDRGLGWHHFIQISRFDGRQNRPKTNVFFDLNYIILCTANTLVIIVGKYYYLRVFRNYNFILIYKILNSILYTIFMVINPLFG